MSACALFVISNTHEFPRTTQGETHGLKTGESEDMDTWTVGFYPPSIAYPYKKLKMKGVEIEICSPTGGKLTVDTWGMELWDHPVVGKCLRDPAIAKELDDSKPASEINGAKYDIVHFVGSKGNFFDVADNAEVKRIVRECYEAGGFISANHEGVAGLLNVKLSNGEYLLNGKKCTGISEFEQSVLDQKDDLPFIMAEKMKEQGCIYKHGIPVKPHVMKDQRIVTGQNPNSAEPLAGALAEIGRERIKAKKLKKEQEAATVA